MNQRRAYEVVCSQCAFHNSSPRLPRCFCRPCQDRFDPGVVGSIPGVAPNALDRPDVPRRHVVPRESLLNGTTCVELRQLTTADAEPCGAALYHATSH